MNYRPTEVEFLLGDSEKARKKLGWIPKTSLEDLIGEMIEFDMREAEKNLILKKKGYEISDSIESLS